MNPRRNQRLVVPVVYVAAMFMSILDTTIVNVALPTIGREFHAGTASVALVSSAYLVSLAVFIPMSGWLGERVGGRAAMIGSLSLFTVASALCGTSSSLGELVGLRVLQGLGGAVMVPVGLAMLFRVYPPSERVRISSVLAVCTALAPALGPILGGVFTSYLTWRLVFLINVPIGAAAAVFGALYLVDRDPPRAGRLDVAGLVLCGVGLGALMYGVSAGAELGWADARVLTTLVVGVLATTGLVLVELRVTAPLIDVRLFTNRLFTAASGLYALGSVAYLGVLYLCTQLFQSVLGQSAVQAGLTILPSAVGVMIGGQIVTRALYPRLGPRRIVLGGLVLVTVACALMATVDRATDPWLLRAVLLVLGLGVAAVFIPSQAASMATIEPSRTGRASAIFNASKQLGGAVGVAVLGTILAGVTPAGRDTAHPAVTGYRVAFVVAAVVALASVLVARTVRDRDAAVTMTRGPRRAPSSVTAAGR